MKKVIGLSLALVGILGMPALAQDKAAPPPGPRSQQMTVEQRNKMAGAHEKMATCLRSARPLAECHQEMVKECQDVMGANASCPMGMGMGHGMGMRQGQATPPAPQP